MGVGHRVGSLPLRALCDFLRQDALHHRRAHAFFAGATSSDYAGTVTLDDTDRVATDAWVAVGTAQAANRARVRMKQRLNAPPVLAFSRAAPTPPTPTQQQQQPSQPVQPSVTFAGLPPNVRLQSARATAPDGSAFVVRLQHRFAAGTDATFSRPAAVDLGALVAAVLPPGSAVANVTETTLDGAAPVATVRRHRWKTVPQPAAAAKSKAAERRVSEAAGGDVGVITIDPFDIRTFVVHLV